MRKVFKTESGRAMSTSSSGLAVKGDGKTNPAMVLTLGSPITPFGLELGRPESLVHNNRVLARSRNHLDNVIMANEPPSPNHAKSSEEQGILPIQNGSDIIEISDDSDNENGHCALLKDQDGQFTLQDSSSLMPTSEEALETEEDAAWITEPHPAVREITGPLRNCICQWAVGYDWQVANDSNPIWAYNEDQLMGQEVMDQVVCYLTFQALLASGPTARPVCLIPPSLFGSISRDADFSHDVGSWVSNAGPEGPTRLQRIRDMVWTGVEPPARVILPVIDARVIHCYLWYGDVKRSEKGSGYSCQLQYLDSLSKPSERTFNARLQEAQRVLRFTLPQIHGEITGAYRNIPAYRQSPGSLDCGVFVCQAVSALVVHREECLEQPLLVRDVRKGIIQILDECGDKALAKLCQGQIHKSPIVLHRRKTVPPPPWRNESPIGVAKFSCNKRNIPRWVAPKYERSLSEPRGSIAQSGLRSVGWETLFGPEAKVFFDAAAPEGVRQFVDSINGPDFQPPPGLLAGVVPKLPAELLKAVLLEEDHTPSRWLPPGIHVVGGDNEEHLESPEDCVGVVRMGHMLSYLKEGRERSHAILTGQNRGEPLRLDWANNPMDLEPEYLCVSLDIDSLSLTATNPQFTMPATLHAYPPRSTTLTTDNGLRVNLNGKERPLSHIPNFTLLNMGINNQFRVNVFFPGMEKGTDNGGRYITILAEAELRLWWESAMLAGVARLHAVCPASLVNTLIRLTTELPKSYAVAETHCFDAGARSFSGYKVMPQILNMILKHVRDVVDEQPRLAIFRGFFFHIWGINLKAVAEAIPERLGGNTVLHALQLFPIVDWSHQNPLDIVVDVGVEINVRRENLPVDVEDVTLLWSLDALKRLVSGSWRKPISDAYVHSHVVGGIAAKPKKHIAGICYKLQAYHKDKVLTYIHRDNSVGTGFSPQDGLLGSKAYRAQTTRRQEAWETGRGSYGARIEWRCGLWAAGEILSFDPELWKTRFMGAGALIAHPTSSVVRLKTMMAQSYEWVFGQMQQLSQIDRQSYPVQLLASALAYLMHGLVKRPDDMSSSRAMVQNLQVVNRAIRFGIASIPLERFGPDMLRIAGEVTIVRYPILKYVARKNPAGARMKGSRRVHQPQGEAEDQAEAAVQQGELWGPEDQAFIERLVNVTFAAWLWSTMPEQDRVQRAAAGLYSGPLLLQNWSRTVDGVTYGVRVRGNGFDKAVDNFFPLNWVHPNPERQWRSLGVSVLAQIQDQIDSMPVHLRAEYSSQLRQAVSGVLSTWEYLPNPQKRTVWSYDGSGKTKRYKICYNPKFGHKRD
ncbi:hypothetical protein FS749_004289 [Ceratobasidium sp. UAMH 11750]|nr:hypothetical protein FS749_004289 [Ceratobasidium sp. UAMH 11750]